MSSYDYALISARLCVILISKDARVSILPRSIILECSTVLSFQPFAPASLLTGVWLLGGKARKIERQVSASGPWALAYLSPQCNKRIETRKAAKYMLRILISLGATNRFLL
jgi:hypothetical protein